MANLGYIQIIRECNQKCRFCSNPPTGYLLTFEQGIEMIDKYIEMNYDGVILTGGEPTISDFLPGLVKYCAERNFNHRILTNGQRLSDMDYLEELLDSGLRHIGISIYSCRNDVAAYLTGKSDSLEKVIEALENIAHFDGVHVDIQTTINKYNADHLYENVKFLVSRFPFLNHFIWNNLDPMSDIVAKNTDTVPKLNDFYLELYLAMDFLSKTKRSFRVERVPLCYLPEFEHVSTETRKIVLNEERAVFFLDQKEFVRQVFFYYEHAKCCKKCTLVNICAGLTMMDVFYNSNELYPVFVDPDTIIKRIRKG
jgi:MoaA/NifB/PqqE/SkfB family radical SAM enzyme